MAVTRPNGAHPRGPNGAAPPIAPTADILARVTETMLADGRLSVDKKVRRKKDRVADLGPAAPLTDLGNAERFVRRHGANVRYCVAWRSWMVWDGTRWRRDDTRTVERYAKDTARSIWVESAAGEHKDERVLLAKWAEKSESSGRLKAMIELAQAEAGVTVAPDAFDRQPFLLNVANGTLDLQTARLLPHDPANLLTKTTGVTFDPEAPCPRWEAFLLQIFNNDVELIAYLRRAIGYSLTADVREQLLHVLHGGGQNGKSTFLEVIAHVFGDYAIPADFTTFLDRPNDSGPRNDIARLAGARLVRSSEVGEGKRLNEQVIKALTGNETISARFLYSEAFDFDPTFKIWLAANHKPVIRGSDYAIWRRVRLVPFLVTISAQQKDETLKAALLDEAPGILTWAVAGCLEWQQQRLNPPSIVEMATTDYRQTSDVIGAFLDDCCDTGAEFEVPAGELYAAYRRWAESGGEFVLSQTAFGRRLDEKGFGVRKSGVKYRGGLRLCDSAFPDSSEHRKRSARTVQHDLTPYNN